MEIHAGGERQAVIPHHIHPISKGGTRIPWSYELGLLLREVIPKMTRLADAKELQDSLENSVCSLQKWGHPR